MPVSYSDKAVRQDSLSAVCERLLDLRNLVLVSNRGPVEYYLDADGEPLARRGAGGLVTALDLLCRYEGLTWIASAIGEGDRRVGEEATWGRIKSPLSGHKLSIRFINSSRQTYHQYYNVICNPLLWFLQHYMWNTPYAPNVDLAVQEAWDNGYVAMNRAFSDAVVEEAKGSERAPVVMLQDYHLYLAGRFIREELPDVVLQHFTHIPWPNADYWPLLPAKMRREICEGMCAVDFVGLQTPRDVRNFLETCEDFLPGTTVDYTGQTVQYDGRTTSVRAYPASISVKDLRNTAESVRVRDYEQQLRPHFGEKTIVRVDRIDPSKNILRGFQAFETLLERHPQFRGVVNFVAFLVPSRSDIAQYERYTDEVHALAGRINGKYSTEKWQPITIYYENNYTQAIAAMRLYDVLMVNSVIDGMNLVAKEGPIVNRKDGVLVLSEGAGAHQQLSEGALSVAPADLEGTAQALHTALTMSPEKRRERAETLVSSIEKADADDWLYQQLRDVYEVLE